MKPLMLDRKCTRCLLIIAVVLAATTAVATQAPTLTIIGVNVVDVVDGRVVPNSTVTMGMPRPLLKFSGGSDDILRDVLH